MCLQVQHYSLALQTQSFRAMAALNSGAPASALQLLSRCLSAHGFIAPEATECSKNVATCGHLTQLHQQLTRLCANAPRFDADGSVVEVPDVESNAEDGESTVQHAAGTPGLYLCHQAVSNGASAAAQHGSAGAITANGDSIGGTAATQQTQATVSNASAGGSSTGYASARSSTERNQQSDGGAASTSHGTQPQMSAPSAAPAASNGGRDRPKRPRVADGVTLVYPKPEDTEDLAASHEIELMLRLQAHLAARGYHPGDVMEMVRLRTLDIVMQVRLFLRLSKGCLWFLFPSSFFWAFVA